MSTPIFDSVFFSSHEGIDGRSLCCYRNHVPVFLSYASDYFILDIITGVPKTCTTGSDNPPPKDPGPKLVESNPVFGNNPTGLSGINSPPDAQDPLKGQGKSNEQGNTLAQDGQPLVPPN